MATKKIKNPSIVAVDWFYYKATRKEKPTSERHWSWPENHDIWALESIIPGEAWNELTEELFEVMHTVIDSNYNNVVYTDFNTSRLARIAYFWNKVRDMPFTNSDIYWICRLSWKKWAKSEDEKINDFKEGRIRKWRDHIG